MAALPKPKTVVLRTNITERQINEIIEGKKTGLFKSRLSKPRKDEVRTESVSMRYECITYIAARYQADYYRKASHEISVPHNVREVVMGDETFPMRKKSGFTKMLSRKKGKNKIDLELEEHVFVDAHDFMYFDSDGGSTTFPYDLKQRNLESYPLRTLKAAGVAKDPDNHEALTGVLQDTMRDVNEERVRDLTEEYVVERIISIYVPIYEARLRGPDSRVAILRIDAVRKKAL